MGKQQTLMVLRDYVGLGRLMRLRIVECTWKADISLRGSWINDQSLQTSNLYVTFRLTHEWGQ